MVHNLLGFLNIDEHAHTRALETWDLLKTDAPAISTRFYRRVRDFNIMPSMSDEQIAHLENLQYAHWEMLFTSRFNNDYVKRASLVGIKHREVGVDASAYIVGYGIVKQDFAHTIIGKNMPRDRTITLQQTLDQYVAIDMAIALSAYSAWLVD